MITPPPRPCDGEPYHGVGFAMMSKIISRDEAVGVVVDEDRFVSFFEDLL